MKWKLLEGFDISAYERCMRSPLEPGRACVPLNDDLRDKAKVGRSHETGLAACGAYGEVANP